MKSKRWLWLAVLPYVVSVSSNEYTIKFKTAPDTHSEYSSVYVTPWIEISCTKGPGSDCEWIQDLADALNQAHERRMERNKDNEVDLLSPSAYGCIDKATGVQYWQKEPCP
jgi:hypothetical protein